MDLTHKRFSDLDAAREWLEQQRWPNGPVCPHCGNADSDKITGLKGKKHRPGLYQCAECREQFTVTVGSVMHRSKLPLTKWVAAIHLMASSKKGMSAHQMHRMLGIGYEAAWFMCHRLREAMRLDPAGLPPMGGQGKVVEADETYIGQVDVPRPRNKYLPPPTRGRKSGPANKRAIVALVERGAETRLFHVANATSDEVWSILTKHVDRATSLHTDESRLYTSVGARFGEHLTVRHSAKEYVRYEDGKTIHSNTVENVFSVFKRGMIGVYRHCAEKHLHRYLSEFEFRYNRRAALGFTDTERAAAIVKGADGRRLTYRRTDEARL